ncbi:hypothetical protein GCM10023340_04150 [Nocardioides marinquilinus]|uniref:Phosphotyrosine protein phosphatase I domain-containing protein n=1 Tax=Nocardioides marinquilinus TaxID=1210400 RepID=A0ABP9P6Y8_9ACTN
MSTARGRILLVCDGNRARSPLAAALFEMALEARGIRSIAVRTAGLRVREAGAPPVEAAVHLARLRGVDLSGHRAKSVNGRTLAGTAIVLTMTESQRRALAHLAPDAVPRTFTLLEVGRLLADAPDEPTTMAGLAVTAHRRRPRVQPAAEAEDVVDPVGAHDRAWRQVYARINDVVRPLVDRLEVRS